MAAFRCTEAIAEIAAFGLLTACSSGFSGQLEAEGRAGSGAAVQLSGGGGGSVGLSALGGSGGEARADVPPPSTGDARPGEASDAGSPPDAGYVGPTGPFDYGGVGELLLVPLVYTDQPVPPIVEMDCAEDPTAGYTEYRDSFVVQRPRNLAAADRFKFENGIYTTWIFPNDQPHKPNNSTKPRTETRFSDLGTGEHIMSLDVMVEPGSDGTVVHQFKSAGTQGGNIGTYLQVNGGTMRDRAGTVASDVLGKWINIKVAFNVPTGEGRIWLNNCLKVTTQKEKNALWYFKFGNYHCDGAQMCRAHFKNIHFYEKGSTDKYNGEGMTP